MVLDNRLNLNVRHQDIFPVQFQSVNVRLVVGAGHPSRSLKYFSGRTVLSPELTVPWLAVYFRVAAGRSLQGRQCFLVRITEDEYIECYIPTISCAFSRCCLICFRIVEESV